jgi:uncharacterized protein YndB with AHSA1/START domain
MRSRFTWKERMMATSMVENHSTEKVGNLKVEVTRVIKATRKRVFDAWTRPEMIRQWFGPGGMKVPEAEADARVDGAYCITMHGAMEPGGAEHTGRVTGTYTRVEPYDALAFTWSANWAPGEESLVTITLRDVAGGTEMKLVHEGFATEESRNGHMRGWTGGIDKLQQLVESN